MTYSRLSKNFQPYHSMKKLLFTSMLLGTLLTACSSDSENIPELPAPQPVAPRGELAPLQLTQAEADAAKASAGFQYALFNSACRLGEADKNILVSPLSARLLLGMLANATDDESRRQIAAAMGCSDTDAVNSLSRTLLTQLPGVDAECASLAMAQSVWHSDRYTVAPAFKEIASGIYSAEFFSRDLSDTSAALSEVNRWCSDKTGGMIPEYLKEFPRADAILFNAVYFKSSWQQRFNPAKTDRRVFRGSRGDTQVSMMHLSEELTYVWGEGFSGVSLLFGNGTAMDGFRMYFLLPDEGVTAPGLAAVIGSVDEMSATPCHIDLSLPRFNLKSESVSLDRVLESMGITGIFQERLQAIFTEPYRGLWKINQGAAVSVDEDGAEVAAVTSAGLINSAGPVSRHEALTFDRPFLFFVTESASRSVLLAGKIMNL